MFNKTVRSDDIQNRERKSYCKPKLEILGDLRSLTLGGSFGSGESGNTPRKVRLGIPLPGDFPLDDPEISGDYLPQ